MMKVLVVHPAQQHSYRLATALYRKGQLYKYVTTVYDKKGSLTHFVTKLLRGSDKSRAKGRVCQDIKEDDVVQFCEAEGLIKLLAMHISKLRPLYKKIKYHSTDRFAKKVAKYAIKNHVDAVVSYDDYSSVLFTLLKENAPDILRIMDVSAANILYMKQIYEKDMLLQPEFAKRLRKERELVWNEGNIKRAHSEIKNTQIFLSPSKFVARSLEYSGVSKKQIKICPYGVDVKQFDQKKYADVQEIKKRPIRFIYVGGVKELKGAAYLFHAIKEIPKEQAELTIVGQYNPKDLDISPYLNRVTFTGPVLHTEVSKLLMKSDVFVFPSLGEGLSLATLEAAACGLPLIVSENSGVNDAITEGQEGFVIPIQSTQALIEKMIWFIEHPDLIEPMGKSARAMAFKYTWDSYYERIGHIFNEIEMIRWEK